MVEIARLEPRKESITLFVLAERLEINSSNIVSFRVGGGVGSDGKGRDVRDEKSLLISC